MDRKKGKQPAVPKGRGRGRETGRGRGRETGRGRGRGMLPPTRQYSYPSDPYYSPRPGVYILDTSLPYIGRDAPPLMLDFGTNLGAIRPPSSLTCPPPAPRSGPVNQAGTSTSYQAGPSTIYQAGPSTSYQAGPSSSFQAGPSTAMGPFEAAEFEDPVTFFGNLFENQPAGLSTLGAADFAFPTPPPAAEIGGAFDGSASARGAVRDFNSNLDSLTGDSISGGYGPASNHSFHEGPSASFQARPSASFQADLSSAGGPFEDVESGGDPVTFFGNLFENQPAGLSTLGAADFAFRTFPPAAEIGGAFDFPASARGYGPVTQAGLSTSFQAVPSASFQTFPATDIPAGQITSFQVDPSTARGPLEAVEIEHPLTFFGDSFENPQPGLSTLGAADFALPPLPPAAEIVSAFDVPASARGNSVDSLAEENWRPAGRMRGSLTGRQYTEALMDQSIIQLSQPVQAARAPQQFNTPRPFIPPQFQGLMAQAGGSGPGSYSSMAGDSGYGPVSSNPSHEGPSASFQADPSSSFQADPSASFQVDPSSAGGPFEDAEFGDPETFFGDLFEYPSTGLSTVAGVDVTPPAAAVFRDSFDVSRPALDFRTNVGAMCPPSSLTCPPPARGSGPVRQADPFTCFQAGPSTSRGASTGPFKAAEYEDQMTFFGDLFENPHTGQSTLGGADIAFPKPTADIFSDFSEIAGAFDVSASALGSDDHAAPSTTGLGDITFEDDASYLFGMETDQTSAYLAGIDEFPLVGEAGPPPKVDEADRSLNRT